MSFTEKLATSEKITCLATLVALHFAISGCGTTPTDWGENVREILDSTEQKATPSGDKEVYKRKEDVRNADDRERPVD